MDKNLRRPSFAPLGAAGAASLVYALLVFLGPGRPAYSRDELLQASRLMAKAEAVVLECRERRGIPVDEQTDSNRTGLVGLETSSITTSLGNLAAKRTTANPNFAGLLVRLLGEAGVRRGDAVAIGASSSFPALIIAALSAAEVMGVRPLVISSLGASEWGANIPAFNWLDMEDCLRKAGVLTVRPIALAVGGDEDTGRDMSPEGRESLRARIKESGIPFVEAPDLRANVEARLQIYDSAAGGAPVKAFINIGGSWANIGTNRAVLNLKPGLSPGVFVPPEPERGVLQAMAERGIPVIHLLNIRGLARRYGLPWDPKPLPRPGEGGVDIRPAGGAFFVLASLAYILFVTACAAVFLKKRASGRPL
jgi:poly-gamma-glutamate system protein